MDQELTPRLKCDVELEISGPNDQTINKWAAVALRKAADMVESGAFDTGFHPITDNTGMKVGELYLDHSEGDF